MLASLGLGSSAPPTVKSPKVSDEAEAVSSATLMRENSGSMSRRAADKQVETGSDRLRKIERRAAAAQQKSLDKKISALTDEMAEVEALLNRSLNSRQVDPSVAEEKRSALQERMGDIENQHRLKAAEVAINMTTKARIAADDEDTGLSPGLVASPHRSIDSNTPTTSSRKGKLGRRTLIGEDDNDKYSARSKNGSIVDVLSIYFGGSGSLPTPVSIQRSGKAPFDAVKVMGAIVGLGILATIVIFYMWEHKAIQVQQGAMAGSRGWGDASD